MADNAHQLEEFINAFIASRHDAADNTFKNWRNTRDKLTHFFGVDRDLGDINAGDGDDWQQFLVGLGLSESTISK